MLCVRKCTHTFHIFIIVFDFIHLFVHFMIVMLYVDDVDDDVVVFADVFECLVCA